MPHPSFVDLTGKRFGKLVVLERVADTPTKSGKKLVTWKCRCDCGNVCNIRSSNLKIGNTKSCGCLAMKFRRTKRNEPNKNDEYFVGQRFGLLAVEKESHTVTLKATNGVGFDAVVSVGKQKTFASTN